MTVKEQTWYVSDVVVQGVSGFGGTNHLNEGFFEWL